MKKLLWTHFSGWTTSNIPSRASEQEIFTPISASGWGEEQNLFTTLFDGRVVSFPTSQMENLYNYPFSVANLGCGMPAFTVKVKGGEIVKCLVFFVSLKGSSMDGRLSISTWSETFPTWSGAQVLPD